MRTRSPSGSKPPKKHLSQDRSKRNSGKPAKRRRAHSSSPSSSSYSLSSDDESPRARRKSSRRKTARSPSPKRTRESRKVERKKAKRARSRRGRSVSSASKGSSRTCSTCRSHSRSRSRSPAAHAVRRDRDRGGERERVGKGSRKSRYRSPSCSTCSGYSTRSGSSRGRSPSREKYRKRDNSQRVKPNKERLSKRGKEDEGRADDRAKIIKAYDDYPSDGNGAGRRRKEPCNEATEKERKEEVGAMEGARKSSQHARDEEVKPSRAEKQIVRDADYKADAVVHESRISNASSARMKSEVVANPHTLEVDDLELMLRQRALENLKKYRDCMSANVSTGDGRNEQVLPESCDDAWKIREAKQSSLSARNPKNLPERKTTTSLEQPKQYQAEIQPSKARLRSVVNPSPEASSSAKAMVDNIESATSKSKQVVNQMTATSIEACHSPNQLTSVDESANKVFPEQTSIMKATQVEKAGAETENSNMPGAEAKTSDISSSGAASSPKVESGNSNTQKTNVETNQFEQKTFSRMHGGEMVQVSYKVYIPKKTPALSRRQLQR